MILGQCTKGKGFSRSKYDICVLYPSAGITFKANVAELKKLESEGYFIRGLSELQNENGKFSLPSVYDSTVYKDIYTELKEAITELGVNKIGKPVKTGFEVVQLFPDDWFTASRFKTTQKYLDMLGNCGSVSTETSQGYDCRVCLEGIKFYICGKKKQKYLYIQYKYRLDGDSISDELYKAVVSRFNQAGNLVQKKEPIAQPTVDFTFITKSPFADLQGIPINPYIDKSSAVVVVERQGSIPQVYPWVPGKLYETQRQVIANIQEIFGVRVNGMEISNINAVFDWLQGN